MTDQLGTVNFIDDGAGLRLIVNENGNILCWRIAGHTVKRLHTQLGWWLEQNRRHSPDKTAADPEPRHFHDR